MKSHWRRGLAGLLVALLVGVISGHVRLRNPATNNPLSWANPSVPVVIQINGSDDVGDLTDDRAIRLALQDWSGIDGSALVLVEDTDSTERARTDWKSKNLHTILFDEDGSTGYFQGAGIVAVTSITYTSAGKITDADVLFNGRDYNFSTSGAPGAFDVQGIAAHELGHVAGFDHSGWAGSVLYPYVDTNDFVARGLSRDEAGAARSVYPAQAFGSISGSVARSADASAVAGAHVVALDEEGRPVTSVLAGKLGNFTLRGLESGRYLLEILPFAGVVSEINLSSGQDIDSDFAALVSVGPIDVLGGVDVSTGALFVESGNDLSLGTPNDLLPLRLIPGGTAGATLRGRGLVEGSLLSASDPDLTVENVTWSGGSVSFRVAVPEGEPFGQVDLLAQAPNGAVSVLTAALEITPADPVVTSTEPSAASASGGTSLVLKGSGFREGCRVLIGDRIYREGLSGGCQLLDDGTLALTLRASVAGTHDVVVIDRSGVEGRLVDGMLLDQRPVIATVFPRAGQSAGGTLVHVTGSGFAAGTRVLLGAVEQVGVQVLDQGRLLFTTGAGAMGTQTLEVLDATGAGAQSTFDFTASVDPTLLVVDPGEGERVGGEQIELLGINLDPNCRVVFGVDPYTGLGGFEAEVVASGNGTSLEIVTPAMGQTGPIAVSIEDPLTGQASVLTGGFTVRDRERSGGAGCATVGAPPTDLRSILESSAWMLLLLLFAAQKSRAAKPLDIPRDLPRGIQLSTPLGSFSSTGC